MMNGKSDLHIHFHGGVGDAAHITLNVPSVNGIATQIEALKQELLLKQELNEEFAAAITGLMSKAQAADDVVADPPAPAPAPAPVPNPLPSSAT